MNNFIEQTRQLQVCIENRLSPISDKAIIVAVSFIVAMVFLWNFSRIVYNALDMWLLYIGTICFMVVPIMIYYINHG